MLIRIIKLINKYTGYWSFIALVVFINKYVGTHNRYKNKRHILFYTIYNITKIRIIYLTQDIDIMWYVIL